MCQKSLCASDSKSKKNLKKPLVLCTGWSYMQFTHNIVVESKPTENEIFVLQASDGMHDSASECPVRSSVPHTVVVVPRRLK